MHDPEPDLMPIDVVIRFLERRRRGAYDEAVRLVAPDAIWRSPVHGPERGKDRVHEMLASAETDTDWFRQEVRRVEARGPRVLVRVRNAGERAERQLDSEQTLAFAVDDGLIREVRIFLDDPAAVEEFWTA